MSATLNVPPPGRGSRIGLDPSEIVSLPLSYSVLTSRGTGTGSPFSATGPSMVAL